MPSVLVLVLILVLVLSEAVLVLVIDRGTIHRKGFGVTITFDHHSRSVSQVVSRVGSDYEHEHRRRATEHEHEHRFAEHEDSSPEQNTATHCGSRNIPGS